MAPKIINKKQYISVRGYWFQGGPGGPACSIAINGVGVGTYTCPISMYNSCQFASSRTYGAGLTEAVNDVNAPKCGDVYVVRGNMPACYTNMLRGKYTYPGTLTYSTQNNFSLPYINMKSPITVTFSWAGGSCWPYCCIRPENSDTGGYNYGWTHGVFFDIAYLYADGSSLGLSSNNYTSLVTWGFSNYKTITTGCTSTFARANSVGGINNGITYGCSSASPENPSLTTVVIDCPSCT